jgi:hypothetical protein
MSRNALMGLETFSIRVIAILLLSPIFSSDFRLKTRLKTSDKIAAVCERPSKKNIYFFSGKIGNNILGAFPLFPYTLALFARPLSAQTAKVFFWLAKFFFGRHFFAKKGCKNKRALFGCGVKKRTYCTHKYEMRCKKMYVYCHFFPAIKSSAGL